MTKTAKCFCESAGRAKEGSSRPTGENHHYSPDGKPSVTPKETFNTILTISLREQITVFSTLFLSTCQKLS